LLKSLALSAPLVWHDGVGRCSRGAAGRACRRRCRASAAAVTPHAYTFLSPPEAAFVEAAVDQLIPVDNLTPAH